MNSLLWVSSIIGVALIGLEMLQTGGSYMQEQKRYNGEKIMSPNRGADVCSGCAKESAGINRI